MCLRLNLKSIFLASIIFLLFAAVKIMAQSVSPPTQGCGNALLDVGEACDLGRALNNGSFGCDKFCQIVPGWTCTSTQEEYDAEVLRAQELYDQLVLIQEELSSANVTDCSAGTVSGPALALCNDYIKKLGIFRALNAVIRVNCSSTTAFPALMPLPAQAITVKCSS